MPLFASKAEPGLFPPTAAARPAARRCLDDGLLRVLRTEAKGKQARDVCGITDAGLQFLLDHASPIGEVIVAAPTYQRIVAEFEGLEAHAGIRPEAGHSAIEAAAAAVVAMPLGRLDPQTTANAGLIVVRVSGYGQDGPYAAKAGFGTPATAFSGLTYLTGYADRAPINQAFPLADYVTGVFAALGALMALYQRDAHGDLEGQEVDLALYESLFRLLEALVPAFDQLGSNVRIR